MDLDKMPAKVTASHQDTSCLTYDNWFYQRSE